MKKFSKVRMVKLKRTKVPKFYTFLPKKKENAVPYSEV